jgi:hypothetical protein
MTNMNRNAIIAAACVAALAVALALVACGGSGERSDDGQNLLAPAIGETEQKTAGEAPLAAAESAGAGVAEGNAPGLVPSGAATFDRKIVQNTSLDLRVADVSKSYADVERIAITAGGFVLSSSVSANQDRPQATITIRVPTAQYQQVVDSLRALAIKVENQTSNAEDVTQQYTDYQARLRSAQALEATYIGLLDRAETIDDILKIQGYLTPVRTEIEQIQGQINAWDTLSSLATITVNLHTAPATPVPSSSTHPDPLKAGSAGWEASLLFLGAVGAGLFATATFVWWLAPVLVVVGVGFLVRYRMTRKSGSAS